MFRLASVLALLVSLVILQPVIANDITFCDGAFSPGHWTTTKISDTTVGGTGSFSAAQAPSGGNPGYYASTTLRYSYNGTQSPPSQGLTVASLYNGATYTPATAGAITSVAFEYDARLVWQGGGTPGVAIVPVLSQGGRYFTLKSWPGNAPGSWGRFQFTALTADDFRDWDGTGQPDFSSHGSTITFGYTVGSACGWGSATTLNIVGGVDNWSATVSSVPVPSTLLGLLSLGGGGVLVCVWRRRPTRTSR